MFETLNSPSLDNHLPPIHLGLKPSFIFSKIEFSL